MTVRVWAKLLHFI